MNSFNKEEEEKIKEDTFLLDNLPGAKEMLSLALPNKDILYYPFSSNACQNLKAFDFISQKNVNEQDNNNFVSIEIKNVTNPQKVKKNKKNQNFNNNNVQKKNVQQKNQYLPPQPKFKVSQSINPDSTWKIIVDYNKLRLEKIVLNKEVKISVENKLILGKIYNFIEDIDSKISVYNPTTLNNYENMKFFGNVSTLEDNHIKQLVNEANVFLTDKIMSVIMTSVYSSHPWHLKIKKLGDNIYIDKMDNSEIDLVTVNESDETPSDELDNNINNYKRLAIEATLINEFIKEQIIDLNSEPYKCDGPNPFVDEDTKPEQIEHLGYVYRVWKLDNLKILIRCQVHSYQEKIEEINVAEKNIISSDDENEEEEEEDEEKKNEDENKYEFVNVYALNEFDKNSYLNKDTNAVTSILKKELINNHLKLTKWGVNCYLAGIEQIKLAFVTRKNLKDNNNHLISGFYNIKTKELLKITNFNPSIAWGIFKDIIDFVKQTKEDSSFILMKTLGTTTSKSMLKLYNVPETYFENLEEEE
jgi:translation initiation factor 3 subunit D